METVENWEQAYGIGHLYLPSRIRLVNISYILLVSFLGYEKAQSNIATILDDHPLSNEKLTVNRHKR